MRTRGSLFARLSWRLILLQFLALTLVVIVASIPESDRRGVQELDDDVLVAIARNLVVRDDRLILPDISVVHATEERDGEPWTYPDFWFIAADALQRRTEYGQIPEAVRPLFWDPAKLVHAEVYRDGGGPADGIVARQLQGPAGQFTIVTGGGPTLDPVLVRLQRIDPFNLFLLIVLMIALSLTIPWLLRRDLAGVARVADEASHIDIDQPGTRLTEANVPTELQGMVRAMNAALARLDQGIEQRKRFLATAAHELRTPVTILAMRIETLPPDALRRQLMLDVARLSSLADQLLDLERLDHDGAPARLLDLGALVAEAVTDIAPLAVALGADLSYEPPAAPVGVRADSQAILRVVSNLVQNAIVHGGPGVAISVGVNAPGDLRVRDNGPGIAAADRSQIFDPFLRRSDAAGAGLGLHLVQQIVTRHGGTIQLSQPQSGGAEFLIRLPPAALAG